MKKNIITEYFEMIETVKEYDGYYYKISDMVTILILGSMCKLKNPQQIHQWASKDRVREFLKEEFQIYHIPCYYWFICILKLIKTESLNKCFENWVYSTMPEKADKLTTISFDGKTIRSTNAMKKLDSPMHIISAQVSELGLTLSQNIVDGKSNEIPAVQELLRGLNIKGTLVTADALNCQKETAEIIIEQKADYLLSVKDNHPNLKKDIEDYVQDKELQNTMESILETEKNRDRIEIRTAYVTHDIDWLTQKDEWRELRCIGAINKKVLTENEETSEWHYYISSRLLTPDEMLHHARMEWSVETMHWLLDVHFDEDHCRVQDKNVQMNLNIARKCAINLIKLFKSKTGSERPISNIMLDCLIDEHDLLQIVDRN